MRESDAEQRTQQIDDETCNERESREMTAAFAESVYNDSLINWRYWVEQMPQLTAGEAARLICALDPDVFKELSNRPNRNDPQELCTKAEMIQRLAERQGLQNASPSDWLEWAEHQGIKVHDGFRMAVESLGVGESKKIEFTSVEAGVSTTYRMTQAEHDEAQQDRRARQSKGYYTMSEVAQTLADTYSLDAAALLKRMKADYHAGNLTIRARDTEAPVLQNHILRDFYDWMFPDDIRAMLAHWKWDRVFPFTPQDSAPAQTETPAPVAVVASVALPKQRVQESRILELLKDQGYEPLKLSQRKPGKPGPKAEIRTLALNEPALFTKSSFEKAWERLRNDGAVAGAD